MGFKSQNKKKKQKTIHMVKFKTIYFISGVNIVKKIYLGSQ